MKNFSELPPTWSNLDRAKIEIQKIRPNWDNPQIFLDIQQLENLITIWTNELTKQSG